MKRFLLIAAILSFSTVADARGHHYGLNCGRFLSGLLHVSYTPLAKEWARKFPHTTAHAGAVVVSSRRGRDSAGHQGGHVAVIRQINGQCRAMVQDNRGTYERNICKNLIAYVSP